MTQIVIYLGEKRSRMATSIDHPNLNFSFELIHISDIDPDTAAGQPVARRRGAGNPVPERQYSPEHPAHPGAHCANSIPAARGDAVARLVILAQLRRAVPAVVEEVEAMGNITFDIKDHPVLNDIFEKGVVEGYR